MFESNQKESELGVLEDYIVVGAGFCVFMNRDSPKDFQKNIQAAIVSSGLGISLDYALKRYVTDAEPTIPKEYDVLQRIYFSGKAHMESTFNRFSEGDEPDAGVLYADVALRRLTSTYFAAGLLYRIGNLFEANAIARVFLEQTAWAYEVYECKDWTSASRVSASRAIGKLKKLIPRAGILYGLFSNDAHLNLEQHHRFIKFEQPPKVLTSLGPRSWLYGITLLELADIFSCVYERNQINYIVEPENWQNKDGRWELNNNRPFLSILDGLRKEWRECFKQSNSPK